MPPFGLPGRAYFAGEHTAISYRGMEGAWSRASELP